MSCFFYHTIQPVNTEKQIGPDLVVWTNVSKCADWSINVVINEAITWHYSLADEHWALQPLWWWVVVQKPEQDANGSLRPVANYNALSNPGSNSRALILWISTQKKSRRSIQDIPQSIKNMSKLDINKKDEKGLKEDFDFLIFSLKGLEGDELTSSKARSFRQN